MEWLEHFLWDFLQVWKWQGLDNSVIAIAVILQAVVAVRLYKLQHSIEGDRKRISVSAQLVARGSDPNLRIMNASAVGVQILRTRFTDLGTRGKDRNEWVDTDGMVIPPYTSDNIPYGVNWRLHILPLFSPLTQSRMVTIGIEVAYEQDGNLRWGRQFNFNVTITADGNIERISPVTILRLPHPLTPDSSS